MAIMWWRKQWSRWPKIKQKVIQFKGLGAYIMIVSMKGGRK